MSVPTFPECDPISAVDAANLVVASIAYEELALAHLINSEAEKIQYVLGTIEGQTTLECEPTIEDLLDINTSVEQMLRNVIKTEIILQFKLEDALSVSTSSTTTSTTTTTRKPHWNDSEVEETEPDDQDVSGDNQEQ